MNARDLMTPNPAVCTMDTPLQEVAHMMVECDCGEIPVVERLDLRRPVGVVTDRDIVCRAVAQGRNPMTLNAGDVMTSPAWTASDGDHADDIKSLMETRQIRRVPVVDLNGELCGIVALADIARHDSRKDTGEVVRQVSAPAR
jgi:CBS domain-containing protein